MAAQKLTISFGLVLVHMTYEPLADKARSPISGTYVCQEHGAGLSQRYLCSEGTPEEHMLPAGNPPKAYQHPDHPGQLVIVENSVLDGFAKSRTKAVEVTSVVDAQAIDAGYYDDKLYLVKPQAGSEQQFDLFATLLATRGEAAVFPAALSSREVNVVLRWSDEFQWLVMQTCRYQSQMRLAKLNEARAASASRAEPRKDYLTMATQILDGLKGEFNPTEVVDTFTPMMEEAIRYSAGEEGATLPTGKEEPAAPPADLLATLQASIEAAKKPQQAKKPSASRRKTTKT